MTWLIVAVLFASTIGEARVERLRKGANIVAFRLSLATGMGARRGTDETGFVRSVDAAVDRFHQGVLRAVKEEAPAGA